MVLPFVLPSVLGEADLLDTSSCGRDSLEDRKMEENMLFQRKNSLLGYQVKKEIRPAAEVVNCVTS